MPLPGEESEVAGVFEQFWESYYAFVEVPFVAIADCQTLAVDKIAHIRRGTIVDHTPWHASLGRSVHLATFGTILSRNVGPFYEITQTSNVMVSPSHDHGSRRGAGSSGMEVCESETIFC